MRRPPAAKAVRRRGHTAEYDTPLGPCTGELSCAVSTPSERKSSDVVVIPAPTTATCLTASGPPSFPARRAGSLIAGSGRYPSCERRGAALPSPHPTERGPSRAPRRNTLKTPLRRSSGQQIGLIRGRYAFKHDCIDRAHFRRSSCACVGFNFKLTPFTAPPPPFSTSSSLSSTG